ncbi:MAG: hypothetical protein HZB79_04345 [Deltaproteobacteria bacterium]|nr:hypothetical protein [Deltaproteobacteria bacterium]
MAKNKGSWVRAGTHPKDGWGSGNLVASLVLLFAFIAIPVNAEMQHSSSHSMEEKKGDAVTVDGVKAVFKLSQTMSMVDIVFSDVKTGNIITKAKVSGMATNPDSTKQAKEFVGMKMDKEYSFGNTLDLSQKGVYKLDVDADIEGKRVKFSFKFEVK